MTLVIERSATMQKAARMRAGAAFALAGALLLSAAPTSAAPSVPQGVGMASTCTAVSFNSSSNPARFECVFPTLPEAQGMAI